ncbi:ArsI/CadI family heavy metal resistance metalloenzyme [Nannocystaceae bacterium ST9]
MSTMQIKTSAVEFPTRMRPHVALATRDIDRAVEFYTRLFMQPPTKLRPGYAKFEVHEPPINLSLNLADHVPEQASPAHFGIQVKSTAEVLAARLRMTTAGFAVRDEEAVTCCYAVQDKTWIPDPDGHQWEVFVVTEADAEVHSLPARGQADASGEPACCAPTCCVKSA